MELKNLVKAVVTATVLSIGVVVSTAANAFGINEEVIYATKDSSFWEERPDPFTQGKAYFLKNTPKVIQYFSKNEYMKNSDAEKNTNTGFVNIFPKGLTKNKDQCVAFVNATGWKSFGVTEDWQKIYKLDKNVVKNLSRGTQIATFNLNGEYGPPNTYTKGGGHAAVFLETTPGGILVVDQNFFISKEKEKKFPGQVAIHEIKFNNLGTVGDAGTYWVFQGP